VISATFSPAVGALGFADAAAGMIMAKMTTRIVSVAILRDM